MPAQPTSPETPTPVVVTGRLHGALDMVRADRIGGWAIDRTNRGAAVEVDVFREGTRVATLRADRPRKDLARGEEEPGNHGFTLALDPPLEPGFEFTIVAVARAGEASVELRRAGGGGPATPERRILERIFEDLAELRRQAPAAGDPAEALQRIELAQARIEAALAAVEAPAPPAPRDLWTIALAALAIGAASLVLGIVSMLS
jgi:hypothetical protein